MINYEDIKAINTNSKYKHIISLGHICAPAMQLEKYNLRDASYPFDWLIFADFDLMLKFIENENEEKLYQIDQFDQGVNNRNHYRHRGFNIRFLHDFNSYEPLAKQFPNFIEKYKRRFKRFYNAIEEPTLFIRYVSSAKEMQYIEEEEIYIESTIKRKCSLNDIIYVINNEIETSLDVARTSPSYDSTVNPCFLDDDEALLHFISKVYEEVKTKNPNKRRSKVSQKITTLKNRIFPEYHHENVYDDTD